MRTAFICLLVLAALASRCAMAQEESLIIPCNECRDIVEHPEDVRNFSVNLLYGSESSLSFDQANRFGVTDTFDNAVTVDINMEFVTLELSAIGSELDYAFTLLLQVRIVYPNGNIATYKFDIADLDRNSSLPVPADSPIEPVTDTSTSGSDGDGDSGEDEEENWSDHDEPADEVEATDDSCSACKAYFDADEDGYLDEDPVEWTEEL